MPHSLKSRPLWIKPKRQELRRRLHQAVLREDLRTPLILAKYEERSQAEIEEILGSTAKAVELRIYRARQQLRASLGGWLETV